MRIKEHLEASKIPKRDLRKLLQKITGFSASDLFLRENHNLDEKQEETLKELIEKRLEGYPLEYLVGSVPFYRRTFTVGEECLIPRPETEGLVEMALEHPGTKVLDICTGTGVIGITMNLEGQRQVTCSDINPKAIALASKNATDLGAEIQFVESDLFNDVEGCFDMILSNPPYIASGLLDGLDVAKYEPHIALDGGDDGLVLIKGILEGAREHLFPGGTLIMEIGYDQGPRTKELAEALGYCDVEISRDLAGLDRYFKGKWSSSLD